MRVVFLCSGNGGNLKFVAHAIRMGWLADAKICTVLSDRECAANVFARAQGLPTDVLDFSRTGQLALVDRLHALAADVVVTTVHKILVPEVVRAFDGKLLNLHYSLLPAFAATIGAEPVRLALDYGAKFVGVTVHLVDEGVDSGRPILQAAAATPGAAAHTTAAAALEAMMTVLFRSGCVGLHHALTMFSGGATSGREAPRTSATLGGHLVHFNPAVTIPHGLEEEPGWAFLK